MDKRHFLFLSAASVLFVALFQPAQLYFLSDDWDSLLFSLRPSNIFHSFRPLSDASLLLDYQVWKMNAAGFHLTNYLLHFGCVFIVYFIAKRLFLLRYEVWLTSNLSLASSLFFLYYPFHSEAVFWIVGRGAILCTLFGLLSLLFFIQKEKSHFYYPLSVLCFAMALMSYEEAWIIPVLITVLAFFYNHRSKANKVFGVIIFWFLFLFYLAGRLYFTKNVIGTPYGSERMMNFDVLFLARNFAAFIFRSFILPLQSSVAFVVLCAVAAVIVSAILFGYRKKINFILILTSAFFLFTLIPVLPLGIDTHDTESERFLYFPSVFFVLSIVQLLSIVFEKKFKIAYVLFLIGIVPLWLSYNSFKLSSTVTKKTVGVIQKIFSADTLFCQRLPGQYKGAFIFRNGFTSVVRLEKGNAIKNVEILSTSELFQPSKNYSIENIRLTKNDSSDNLFITWTEQRVILKN